MSKAKMHTLLLKLGRVVTIELWSLRNAIGIDMGVIFDVDTRVKRKARRVLCSDLSWKWQIVYSKNDLLHDYFIETDIFCVDEYLDELEATWE